MWKSIREYYRVSDFPTTIRIIVFMWRCLTINIDRRIKKGIPIIYYVIFIIASSCHFYIYIYCMVCFIIERVSNPEEHICIVIMFALGVNSSTGVVKFVCMYINRDKIRDIVDGYLACHSMIIPGSRISEEMAITLRLVRKRAFIYFTVIMSNVSFYIVLNMSTSRQQLMNDCNILSGMYEIVYITPYYEIFFFFDSLAVLYVCYLQATVTTFFFIIVGYTEAQVLALSKELSLLWHDANNSIINETVGDRNSTDVNDYISKRIEDITKIHTMHLELIATVESSLRLATLMQYGTVVSALIAVLLGGLEYTYFQLPFGIIIIGMDCFMGQKLTDSGKVFEKAVFECGWEYFDCSNRKYILLMLLNAQKDLKLSAGSLKPLNYEFLMGVIRGIYSAYAAIRSSL